MKPGEYFLEDHEISANAGRRTTKVLVKQTGDRPVQVGQSLSFLRSERRPGFLIEMPLAECV